MFFPDRIKGIKPSDKVLEIGPGADPFHRSDILLEKKFATEEEYTAQFGHANRPDTNKKIIYYKGPEFPFADNEFDYVICSHVLEHVDDPEFFISEIFRVSSGGYFEYPLMYYEYLYNFDVHKNLIKFDGKKLWFMKKDKLPFEEFRIIQDFFLESLRNGHNKLINDLLPFMMEGFEWSSGFEIENTNDINKLGWKNYSIKPPVTSAGNNPGWNRIRQLINKIRK
jgi:SAM-dependent methyltransferase